MQLFALDNNPIPAGAAVGSIASEDGIALRYASWRPAARPSRGTVCLIQGVPHTIEHYFEVVGELRAKGYAVAAFDWRSQAGSQRRLDDRGIIHVSDFEEYDRDLDGFVREVERTGFPKPYFALAYSVGALLCLRHLESARAFFERAVLLAPMLTLRHKVPIPLLHLRAWLTTVMGFGERPATRYSPHGGATVLTRDRQRFERDRGIWTGVPTLANASRSYSWMLAFLRAGAAARRPDFGPAIGLPVLICIGTGDRLSSLGDVKKLAARIPNATLAVFPDARHAILSETDETRAVFWAAFDAFMADREPNGRAHTSVA